MLFTAALIMNYTMHYKYSQESTLGTLRTKMYEEENGNRTLKAGIPVELKGIRACLRCSLVKNFGQFIDHGCENCKFLGMEGNQDRAQECTTSYFEGLIGLVDPSASWVAKWQRVSYYLPGMYAIEMIGELPEDAIDYCENNQIEYKSRRQMK